MPPRLALYALRAAARYRRAALLRAAVCLLAGADRRATATAGAPAPPPAPTHRPATSPR